MYDGGMFIPVAWYNTSLPKPTAFEDNAPVYMNIHDQSKETYRFCPNLRTNYTFAMQENSTACNSMYTNKTCYQDIGQAKYSQSVHNNPPTKNWEAYELPYTITPDQQTLVDSTSGFVVSTNYTQNRSITIDNWFYPEVTVTQLNVNKLT